MEQNKYIFSGGGGKARSHRASRGQHARHLLKALLASSTLLACSGAMATETVSYSYDALGRLLNRASSGSVNNGVAVATVFDPAGNRSSYAVTGVVGAGTPSFSIASAPAVTEGGTAVFTVTRSGSTAASNSVNYAATAGSATAGSDFTAVSGTLTFAAGVATQTISVPTSDDALAESTESFTMTLSGATGGATIATAQATGTINDNDGGSGGGAPSFAIGNAPAVAEGGNLVFPVTKSGTATGSFSVSYATASGTATSGSDFTANSNTLTFLASDTIRNITVATTDDSVAETAETVLVNLSAPTGGSTITTSQGSGTINDNDSTAVSFAISNAASVAEGGSLLYTVTKSGATAANYSVNFATADGTAVSTSDYSATSGTLTFLPGETSKTISVVTTDDTLYEGDETVLVNLSAPSGGATITTAQGSGTIPGNDLHPPVTVNDTKSMAKCQIATINLTANDSDPDGYLPLTITALSGAPAVHATIVSASSIEFDAQVSGTNQILTYTVQDTRGAIASATGQLVITVTGTALCN